MTPGLYMHSSNRLEELARLLAAMLREESGSVFSRVPVVVQTPGVARWLSLRLADMLGGCLGLEFLFPRNFVDRMSERLLGGRSPAHPDRLRMTWRIFSLLPELTAEDSGTVLASYLSGAGTLGRYQLSARVADLFDQYLIHRPDMVAHWEAGDEADDWQARLWRSLSAREPLPHLAALLPELGLAEPPPETMPERVFLFALSTLPPLYIHLLKLLGRHTRIELFLLAPSREYWGDTPGRRESALAEKSGEAPDFVQPLLASMGEQGRDFFNLLVEEGGFDPDVGGSFFAEPETGSTLARLQGDLLDLRTRHEALPETGDTSLAVSRCAGPMREVEALFDHILSLLDADGSLRPRDILVLMPRLDVYAPCIEAVFGSGEPSLPFALADGKPREAPAPDAFLRLLALVEGRRTVRELLDFMENPAVSERFGFDAESLARAREMCEATGVRWGLDADDRARLGFGTEVRNSWKAGMDGLALGAMMDIPDGDAFLGVLPFRDAEGDRLDDVSKMIAAFDVVRACLRELERERPLREWRTVLEKCVSAVLPESPSEDMRQLRKAIEDLCRHADCAGDDPLDIRSVRAALSDLLDESPAPHGFLSGGVTFAELKPMRSVPSRVICLLGMDDESFPRQERPLSFDRIRRHPRPGDRSSRAADRYLFLETLLCAREHLYFSYSGISATGGNEKPPSVMLSELLEYLAPGRPDLFVRTQPIQAFSASCFVPGSPDWSYSRENYEAARVAAGMGGESIFCNERIQPQEELPELIDLSELTDFLVHPAKYFVRNVLGMDAPRTEERMQEDEPRAVDGLDLFRERTLLVERSLRGGSLSAPGLVAKGILPWGLEGEAQAAGICSEAIAFSNSVRNEMDGPECVVQSRFGPYEGSLTLSARVDSIYGGRYLSYRCARFRAADRVRAWVTAVAMGALREAGAGESSALCGVSCLHMDQSLQLNLPSGASERLAGFVSLFREGRKRPIPLFASSSHEAAVSVRNRNKTPLERAQDAWMNGVGGDSAERDDVWNAMAFRGGDPLAGDADEFIELAHRMWDGYAECVAEGGRR